MSASPVKVRLTITVVEEYEVTLGQDGYTDCKTPQDILDLDLAVTADDPMSFVDNAIADGHYTVKVELADGAS